MKNEHPKYKTKPGVTTRTPCVSFRPKKIDVAELRMCTIQQEFLHVLDKLFFKKYVLMNERENEHMSHTTA